MSQRATRSTRKPSQKRMENEAANNTEQSIDPTVGKAGDNDAIEQDSLKPNTRLKKRPKLTTDEDIRPAPEKKKPRKEKKELEKKVFGKKSQKLSKKECEKEIVKKREIGKEKEEDRNVEDNGTGSMEEKGEKGSLDPVDSDEDIEEEILDEDEGNSDHDILKGDNKNQEHEAKPNNKNLGRNEKSEERRRKIVRNKSPNPTSSNSIDVDKVDENLHSGSEEKRMFLRLDGTVGCLQPFHKDCMDKQPAGLLGDTSVDFLASLILRPSQIVKDTTIMPLLTYKWIDNSEDHVSRIVKSNRFVFDAKNAPRCDYWVSTLEQDILFAPVLYSGHWSLLAMKGTKSIRKYVNGSWKPGKDKIVITHMDSLRNSTHSKDRMKNIIGWLATGLCIMSKEFQSDSVTSTNAVAWLESITTFEVDPSFRGQQNPSSLNCGWWVAVNARYYILRECGQKVHTPSEEDVENERKTYRSVVDVLPKNNINELEPASSSSFHYNIPDLFRCTRKYLDEALLFVADFITAGGARNEAENRSKKRKRHIANRMKGLKFQYGSVTVSTTRKERLGLADICEYFPPEDLSSPIFKTMSQYSSSTILNNGVKTVFGNEGKLTNKEDSTVKAQLAHVFKLADCSSTNTQADTLVFTISARAHLQTMFVHFIGITEAVFLAKHKHSTFSLDVAGAWNVLDEDNNCAYPITSDDIIKEMKSNETNEISSSEANREISKIFVSLLGLIHSSMKLGLRNLRNMKKVSPGTVLNGAKQLTETDIGISRELMEIFLSNIYKECLDAQHGEGLKILVCKMLGNFLHVMKYSHCESRKDDETGSTSNARESTSDANETAKELMELYWKPLETGTVSTKRKVKSKSGNDDGETQIHINQSNAEHGRVVGSFLPFERWLTPITVGEPVLWFSATILFFLTLLKEKKVMHEKNSAGCRGGNCSSKAINELTKFSSASQLMNKTGQNPLFSGNNDGDGYMIEQLNWVCLETMSDIIENNDLVCSDPSPNGLSVPIDVHGEVRIIEWKSSIFEISNVTSLSPRKYSAWLSKDEDKWGIGGLCFGDKLQSGTIVCKCSLAFNMPMNERGMAFKDVTGEDLQVGTNQVIQIQLCKKTLLGMTISEVEVANLVSPTQLYTVNVMVICTEDELTLLSSDELDLAKCFFFPSKNFTYEEKFLIFKGLHKLPILPSSFLKSLYDPRGYNQEQQFIQDWKLRLLITSGKHNLFKNLNHGDERGFIKFAPTNEYKKCLVDSVDEQIKKFGNDIEYNLFDAQRIAVRGWMYKMMFEKHIREAMNSRLAADTLLRRMNSSLTGNISFIHGPPGTGKSAVAKFLMTASSMKFSGRVLVLSTTNEAVDNVLIKYNQNLASELNVIPNGTVVRLGTGSTHRNVKLLELRNLKKRKNARSYGRQDAPTDNDDKIVNDATIAAGTFGSAIRMNWEALDPFDMIIVDEAAHAEESLVIATLSTIMYPRCNSYQMVDIVFMGDHKQLNPYFHDSHTKNLRKPPSTGLFFYRIMMEIGKLSRSEETFMPIYTVLDTQYRMAEPIMKLLRNMFYPFLKQGERSSSRPWITEKMNLFLSKIPVLASTIVSFDMSQFTYIMAQPVRGKSWKNDYEVMIVKDILLKLFRANKELLSRTAVLTPYAGQVFALKRELTRINALKNVYYGTFDSSQGQEFDITILSLVRTGRAPRLSFLDRRNSICMALSRAREHLYIVGSFSDVCNGSQEWKKVFRELDEMKKNDKDFSYLSVTPLHFQTDSFPYEHNQIKYIT